MTLMKTLDMANSIGHLVGVGRGSAMRLRVFIVGFVRTPKGLGVYQIFADSVLGAARA